MSIPILALELLSQKVNFSTARCDSFVEACKVCLEDQKHQPNAALLKVDGMSPRSFTLAWKGPLAPEAISSWDDPEEATEHGACAIAFLVVLEIEQLKVIRRSRKRTGIDYWLARQEDQLVQNAARLEISGIRKGDNSMIQTRLNKKKEQTKQSDAQNPDLPAYVVVVEFSNPVAHMEVRNVQP